MVKNHKLSLCFLLQKLAKIYRHQKFEVGEDGHAYAVKMKYYAECMMHQKDDSPRMYLTAHLVKQALL